MNPVNIFSEPHDSLQDVFDSLEFYHRSRPGHSASSQTIGVGLLVGDTNRVSGELAEWDILFHPSDLDVEIGDTLAHRIVHADSENSSERATFILLATDATPVEDLAHCAKLIIDNQRRGNLADVSGDTSDTAQGAFIEDGPERSYDDPGRLETWWRSRITHHRGVTITTRIKTLQASEGAVTAQDVAISISDGRTPRYFSVPVAVLGQVVAALELARYDAEAVILTLKTQEEDL